jgi:chemotaxis protein histidine kinase CheA
MNNLISGNPFIFNENIDIAFLHDMYQDDIGYVEEMFGNIVKELEENLPLAEAAANAKDLKAFRKAVHKLKPCFGFAGLTTSQARLQRFEDVYECTEYSLSHLLLMEDTLKEIVSAKQLVKTEYLRLKEFNESRV